MAMKFLNTVKYWSKTIGVTVGMSLLRTYSNSHIFIHNQCTKMYDSNDAIQYVCNCLLTWTHPLLEWMYLKKIEPFYEPWCSLSYNSNNKLCEHYLNFNKPSHYISLFNKQMLFYYNPFVRDGTGRSGVHDQDDANFTYVSIQNILHDISNVWSNTSGLGLGLSSDPLLIIIKKKHQYISRVILDKNHRMASPPTYKIEKMTFEKTRKHLLCVEYIHPKMDQSIYLDINPGYYVEGNAIFSELFVKRCLQYQNSAYVFDSDYKLKIMDSMMRTVEMHSNEYMIIDKNNYIIYKR